MSAPGPTLAVVISNFNYARFLPQALDSVLAQTPPIDEIVVVDDGSTDTSSAVLARYAGRVDVLTIPNGGQLGACRVGIAATTSEYIYSLDADDYVAPNFSTRIRAALASRPAKVQFQLYTVGNEGNSLGSKFPTYPSGYDAAAMRHDNAVLGFYICPPTSGNVFSREALERIDLFSFDARGAFDGSPALAMPYLGEIISLNEPLAYYRVHGSNLGSWDKPTIGLLWREIELFQKARNEVVRALDLQIPPYLPLWVREREMMIAAMENRLFIGRLVWRYIAGIPRTHLPSKQKLILTVWATALLLPSDRVRSYCIRVRRSSANRSRSLQAILNFIRRMSQ